MSFVDNPAFANAAFDAGTGPIPHHRRDPHPRLPTTPAFPSGSELALAREFLAGDHHRAGPVADAGCISSGHDTAFSEYRFEGAQLLRPSCRGACARPSRAPRPFRFSDSEWEPVRLRRRTLLRPTPLSRAAAISARTRPRIRDRACTSRPGSPRSPPFRARRRNR